ncbi:MAG: hypothetical protein QXJ68_05280 [Methanocellales archaeon]
MLERKIPSYGDKLSKIYIEVSDRERISLESKDEAALLLELNECICSGLEGLVLSQGYLGFPCRSSLELHLALYFKHATTSSP